MVKQATKTSAAIRAYSIIVTPRRSLTNALTKRIPAFHKGCVTAAGSADSRRVKRSLIGRPQRRRQPRLLGHSLDGRGGARVADIEENADRAGYAVELPFLVDLIAVLERSFDRLLRGLPVLQRAIMLEDQPDPALPLDGKACLALVRVLLRVAGVQGKDYGGRSCRAARFHLPAGIVLERPSAGGPVEENGVLRLLGREYVAHRLPPMVPLGRAAVVVAMDPPERRADHREDRRGVQAAEPERCPAQPRQPLAGQQRERGGGHRHEPVIEDGLDQGYEQRCGNGKEEPCRDQPRGPSLVKAGRLRCRRGRGRKPAVAGEELAEAQHQRQRGMGNPAELAALPEQDEDVERRRQQGESRR